MMFDCPSHMITTRGETQTVLVVLPIGALWAGWKSRKGTERKKLRKELSKTILDHACQKWEGQKSESTYVTVRSSLVPIDVEGGWSRAGQVVGGNLLKEKITFLSLVSKSTCSSMTRPASKRSISEDLFIVPTLILRPPSLRSRYLFADFIEKRNHRNICQEDADELRSNNLIWLLEHCLHSVWSL